MKKINLYIFILLSPFAHAEPSHDMARFQELGALHVQKYNNPQCRALGILPKILQAIIEELTMVNNH
ncbi:hypothetical protein [Acinetobacter seifertii]|uniref:hypothetical protein n=1 Tax=Acinetobacter seifertii TaxID=1530123 RepID=UPI000C22DA80|nr:hypothetical protein [Acinetobacter seifertii]PJG66023.1 hypothetical protein CVD09_13135 [Acinetobacter seifertii]